MAALVSSTALVSATPMTLFAVVYCAIFPTVICFTLQNSFQRYVTPTRAGLVYTLDPVWSLLAGFCVLGERLLPLEWLGCAMIFLAALVPLAVRFVAESQLLNRYSRKEYY
jgi:drug/metabolite transporter (DMT)-like permease